MMIDDENNTKARDVIRLIPYIYMVSPKEGKEVKLRLDIGFEQPDAEDFTKKLTDELADTPRDVLKFLKRQALLESADDWRFMSKSEIDDFLRRDVDEENGVDMPSYDEVPPDNFDEDF